MAVNRDQWNSQIGFLFAAVGSAVGLGNIWRFSYMAYEHGGGAFLIPYVVALVTCGIPLLVLEFALGHERTGSAPLAFAKINRKAEFFGWWPVSFVMFGIVLYYCVIIAWCLNYCFYSLSFAWGQDPNGFFFKEFLKLPKGPLEIHGINLKILLSTAVIWFLNWLIVFRGIGKGIELANKIFMPLLFFLTLFLVFWALTLPGATDGALAYLRPNFQKISRIGVWIDAYSQIFFSLSLGFGIMIAYASYLPRKADIAKNAVMTSIMDSLFAIVAGLGVFAVLGFMANAKGLPISKVVSESIGLAFVAYPQALSIMPGGSYFGVFFFLSLVVAGLSSSISILEAFTSAVIDKFNMNRGFVVSAVCFVGFLGSAIFTTNAGLFWLDIVDHFLTHYGLVVVGIAECIIGAWVFDVERLRRHVNKTSSIKMPKVWDGIIRYFVPAILLTIVAGDLYAEIHKPYGGYSWFALAMIGINWMMFTILIAAFLTKFPWHYEYMLYTPDEDEEGQNIKE
ncbi:MAG: sodium-dependent transporter [Thermodesulfobacteria bacterium]|nr:sodium-dependent transporter [Thermodesulfobacteriota bacterium]